MTESPYTSIYRRRQTHPWQEKYTSPPNVPFVVRSRDSHSYCSCFRMISPSLIIKSNAPVRCGLVSITRPYLEYSTGFLERHLAGRLPHVLYGRTCQKMFPYCNNVNVPNEELRSMAEDVSTSVTSVCYLVAIANACVIKNHKLWR